MKLKLSLDVKTAKLLRLEAFGRDCTVSQVVRDMVAQIPQRFVLTDRGPRGEAAPLNPPLGFTAKAPESPSPTGPLGVVSSDVA